MCSPFRARIQPAVFRTYLLPLFAAIAIAFCGLCFRPSEAEAGTATGNLTVQLTVTSSCTIGAATLNFGSVAGTSLLATPVTGSTTVSVTCTNGSPYSIGMGQGANYLSTNRMASGTNYIGYNLYTDSAYTHLWGTTTSASSCTGGSNTCDLGTGNGSAQTVTIYGQIPIVATAPASGSYSDTVIMTITY